MIIYQSTFVPLFCSASSATGNLFCVSFSGFHFSDLQQHVRQILTFALSDTTKRNYHSVWNTYMKFCHFYSLSPFPASPSAITAFIVLASCSVKSHHTINNYLSALRRLHILCNFNVTAFDDIQIKLTQKGLENSMVHVPRRKAPLTPLILLQFHANLNVRDSAHLALWSAFVVGFFTFFRTANLVPSSLGKFSPHNALSRDSVTFTGSFAILTVTYQDPSVRRYCTRCSDSSHSRLSSLPYVGA